MKVPILIGIMVCTTACAAAVESEGQDSAQLVLSSLEQAPPSVRVQKRVGRRDKVDPKRAPETTLENEETSPDEDGAEENTVTVARAGESQASDKEVEGLEQAMKEASK